MALQRFASLACSCLIVASASLPALGITTSGGQSWNYAPDAWARGNFADTSYFGWDLIEHAGLPNGPMGSGRLDDSTPDLGSPTTAIAPRLFQSLASLAIFGHRSGSGNYYSGFQGNAFADDTISATATAPVGQSGGFTTVVLQVIGQPTNALGDLSFMMEPSTVAWTKQKDLYGVNSGAGVYWQEWTAPGANLPFAIHMTSATSSRGIDAFQIDAHWSPNGPVINAISAIPEPSSVALASAGLLGMAGLRRWRRHANVTQ
jgi:hypothetical protein